MNNPINLLFDGVKEDYNWISPCLCGELYQLCKGMLFEDVDGIQFYLWLNMRLKKQLTPKPWARSQIKYIIHRLSGLIDVSKDPIRHIDPSVSEDFTGLPDNWQKAYIRGLDNERKKILLMKSWEKGVIEKCGISYMDMIKHWSTFCQDMTNNNSRRAKEKQQFIENLDLIIDRYK